MNNSRVLVTGAGGFIGRHLIDRLRILGAGISTLVRNAVADHSDVTQYLGDIRDAGFVADAVAGAKPEFIFHLCASKNRSPKIDEFLPAIETNLMGGFHLLAAAGKLGALRSIVVIGTAEEYGKNSAPFVETMRELPVNAYSQSKQSLTHLCEVMHALHGLPVVVLRPTIAYGPGQSTDMFLPALICSLLAERPFPMTAGEQTRDFVYVSDVVDAMLLAATGAGTAGQVMNIGCGQPLSIAAVAHKVAAITGNPHLLQLGHLPYRQGEIMSYTVDTAKARALLGWSPQVGLDDGLAATLDFFRNNA